MATLLLFNKPFQVLTQFTDAQERTTLAHFIPLKGVYPAGRLDYDSEGLLLLTDDGTLQHEISHPLNKMEKTYWVQVEGEISQQAIKQLERGLELKDGITAPATAKIIPEPSLWDREPPIRERKNIPTSWIELKIKEGKNRQVRRMTAAVGYPTLRLVRVKIGEWTLENIDQGQYKVLTVDSPKRLKSRNRKQTPRHLNTKNASKRTHQKPRSRHRP
jgi:23S rRNA pseudouridine2457 synthase